MNNIFNFKAKVWTTTGRTVWHMVTLPINTAEEINYFFFLEKQGWGSLPVRVTVGSTIWKTSIFTDKKNKSYILPLKKDVREEEGIVDGDMVSFSIEVKPK